MGWPGDEWPKNIGRFSTKELEEELEARKKKALQRPEQTAIFDATKIRKACEEYLDELDSGIEPNDRYVFEAVMEMLYGPKIWRYINARS